MNKQIFIDLHAIQTVPPSCVNRDDTGSPKTAVYGGTERARISSQAWKRAMRVYFKDIFSPEALGSRTKHVPEMIAEEILKIAPELGAEKASKAALNALKSVGIKTDEKKNENSALFFISDEQVKALAKLAAAGETDKKVYSQVLRDNPS